MKRGSTKRNSSKWLYRILASGLALSLALIIILRMDLSARISRTPAAKVAIPENLSDFRHIHIEGNWYIEIIQGGEFHFDFYLRYSPKNNLDYDPQIAQAISIKQEGATLILRSPLTGKRNTDNNKLSESIWQRAPSYPEVYINMPYLEKLRVAGASKVLLEGDWNTSPKEDSQGGEKRGESQSDVQRNSFWDFELSGTSRLTVRKLTEGSQIQRLNLRMSDASSATFGNGIHIENATVNLNGNSYAKIHMAGGRLKGFLSGTAEFVYSGVVAEQELQTNENSKVSLFYPGQELEFDSVLKSLGILYR